jgi:UDP-N-acetylmuramoyl-tripeptide--D-alanyl-D-alanine ligase
MKVHMKGLTCKEFAYLLGSQVESSQRIEGFEFDSRKIQPGFVFFALKGETVDGHDFLTEVAQKKATAAVVSSDYKKEIPGLVLIRVPHVVRALQDLAKIAFAKRKRKVIGVTGSVGKTTTKEFISTILEGAFAVKKTPGNANSQVSLPLTILNSDEKEDVFVAEMGMSQHHEIEALIQIAPPDLAVITKIALSHALFFPRGLEEVAEAKSEILLHPNTQEAIVNSQAARFPAIQKTRLPVTYYRVSGDESELLANEAGLFRIGNSYCIRIQSEKTTTFHLPFQATHLCENFLAAALVARRLGMEWDAIFFQAQKLTPYKMRFEKTEKNGVIYINDSYNANPESMKAALHNLPKPTQSGKTIAVLGEMRELGVFSEDAHREIGREASKVADLLLCLGRDCTYMAEEFARSNRPVLHFFDFFELKKAFGSHVQQGDVVLVKASNSLKLWRILED